MAYQYVDNPPEFQKLLRDIFTDQFMMENTRFQSFEAFQYSSAVFVNWNSSVLVYSEENLDVFVRESTTFSSWEEMVLIAANMRYRPIASE